MDTTTQADPNAVPVAGNTVKTDKGTHVLERIAFESGEAQGFEFFVVEYRDLEAAKEKFGKGDKKAGEQVVLGLVNSALRFALRNRAKSRMPDDEDDAKRLERIAELKGKGETLLQTEVEAENYIPGTREKTSIQTLTKELLAAKKAGNMELAVDLLKQIRELQAKLEEELLNSLNS